ncbi:hypothetical protein NBRC116493_17220 [Aurantivibrio infirmus]
MLCVADARFFKQASSQPRAGSATPNKTKRPINFFIVMSYKTEWVLKVIRICDVMYITGEKQVNANTLVLTKYS